MHVIKEQGFSKEERLCRKKDIQELFIRGSSFYLAPFRIKHLPADGDAAMHRVLISVPKRLFRKAADRNRVRRRIRESYRRHKGIIAPIPPRHIAIIVSSRDRVRQTDIDSAMTAALKKLAKLERANGTDS